MKNKNSESRYSLSAPDVQADDIDLVMQVLRSDRLSGGPFLESLEQNFASYIGTKYAIGVANGTAALHLCIRAAEIKDGDEVITTPLSFIASANCIFYERAKPVFVDVDATSLNLDPARIEGAITDRTKAVLPVHLFGQPAAMDEVQALCRTRNLVLIEDACQAVGAEYKGRKVGTFGKAAAFSFYPNKLITLGEGGMITTNDREWAALLRSLRNQGRDDAGAGLAHNHLGYNYRLDEMSAALGVAQLRRLDRVLARREEMAGFYEELIRSIPGVTNYSVQPSTTRMSRFAFVVHLDPSIKRDRVIAQLESNQIQSRAYFAPIHLQPYYREHFGFCPGDFPIAERIAASTLALPFHTGLSQAAMERIADALKAAIGVNHDR